MWTVPQSVLRLVALLLLACAVGAFALGLIGAEPGGGRLPGEAEGEGAVVAPVIATEAQPLQEGQTAQRPQETAEAEDEAEDTPAETASADPQVPALQVADEAPAPRTAPPPPKAQPAPAAPPPGDAIGDLVDGLTPPSDLPPF